jgi:hypothetical protein
MLLLLLLLLLICCWYHGTPTCHPARGCRQCKYHLNRQHDTSIPTNVSLADRLVLSKMRLDKGVLRKVNFGAFFHCFLNKIISNPCKSMKKTFFLDIFSTRLFRRVWCTTSVIEGMPNMTLPLLCKLSSSWAKVVMPSSRYFLWVCFDF